MRNVALPILIVYVLGMIALGYWAMRRTKSVGDFFLGGRNIGPWISAFTYGTTYFSAVLFVGYGGKLGWGFGLHTLWIALGNTIVGTLLAWLILGKRTREMTARLNALTMPAFLAERYKSPALKVAAAILIFVFLVPYCASVYSGLSYLFEKVLGLSSVESLSLLAVLTGVYLVMGGYLAVTLTDFIMGLTMIFGVAALMVSLLGDAGGFMHATKLLTNWREASPALFAPTAPGQVPNWMTLWSLVILTSLGPWGLPQMVQKFYSIKSASQVKRAAIVATVFCFIVSFGAYYNGALTHVNIPPHPQALEQVTNPVSEGDYTSPVELPVKMGSDGQPVMQGDKKVIDWDRWIPTFLSQRLPAWILLVIMLLVFAASMSTLSSLVLVSSSAIAMDLYAGILNPNVERRGVLTLMRALCGVFILASLFITLQKPTIIINLMAISWGALAGSFGAPYIYGLFWRRTTPFGAGMGMFFGVGTGLVLFYLLGEGGIPLAGAVAILVPFVIVPIFSLLTPPMSRDYVQRAFAGEAKPAAAAAAKEG